MILVSASAFCFAEEGSEKIKPNSRVGVSFGTGNNLSSELLSKHSDMKVDLFYHKTLSKYYYLSFNAGYVDCPNKNNYIPITVGINIFYPNNYLVPYYGIELGLSNRLNIIDGRDDNHIGLLYSGRSGLYVPIPNININLGVGMIVQIATNNTGFLGFNWIISYTLPY